MIYIPSSAEWGSFPSLGESCLSAVSLTEIILTTTGIIVYLEGKERCAASKTQTKQEAILRCTIQLWDCCSMDMGTIPTTGKAPPEGGTHKGSTARPRAAVESGLGAAVLGEPTCSPARAQQRGAPRGLRAHRNRNCRAALAAQGLCVCMHTAVSLQQKLLQSPSQKTGDCSTK